MQSTFISDVYGENIMNDGMVRKWVRAFKDGRTNIHDEERNMQPSVIIDDLIQKVYVKENNSRFHPYLKNFLLF